MKKIAVLGVGNILFKDEGIGIYIVKYLQENYKFSPNIDLIDAGTLGFRLMEYLEDYDHVILVDTISIDDKPGSVYRLTADEILELGEYKQTAHEVEVVQMLGLTKLKGKMAEVVIVGIVPELISVSEIGLTKTLEDEGFKTGTYQVLKELERLGVSYEKVNNIPLKEVVKKSFGSYNNELSDKRIREDG